MRSLTRIGLVAGLILLIGLLIWQGVFEVLRLLAASGWALLWLPVAWLPQWIPATQAWRLVFEARDRPRFLHALLAMWMGRAVNNLLPVATIGGEVVKARLAFLWGTRSSTAAASVIIDKTVQVLAVVAWGLIGVFILLKLALNDRLAALALAGFAFLTLGAVGFIVLQRAGMFEFLARIGERLVKTGGKGGITASAAEIDRAVVAMYRHRFNIYAALLLKTLGLVLQTAEVWLACFLLGHPISLLEAIMLKSLTSTLADIAFVVPSGYGVQEGVFILVGALVGLSPEVALAVSLSLRIRDLLFDPAGLLTLHQIEVRHWSRRVTD